MNDRRQLRWAPRSSDGVIYDGARGADSEDSLCSVPTYEGLLKLPAAAITGIGYEYSGGRFLIVSTQEELYIGQYWLSTDTGLLHQAFFYNTENPAELVYSMKITDYCEGDPGDGYFTQPDGTVGLLSVNN
jgi:hypothetical protein